MGLNLTTFGEQEGKQPVANGGVDVNAPKNGEKSSVQDIIDGDPWHGGSDIGDVDGEKVTIPHDVPLVILYGPKTSGKTTILMRLARYICKEKEDCRDYSCKADRRFRQGDKYGRVCDEFEEFLRSDEIPVGNSEMNFMLARVYKHGVPLFQILEAPGEHFFVGTGRLITTHAYLNQIYDATDLQRIFAFVFDFDMRGNSLWRNEELRRNYAGNVRNMLNRQRNKKRDRFILLANKVDVADGTGTSTKMRLNNNYDGIGNDFERNESFFNKLFGRKHCMLDFQSGYFYEKSNRFLFGPKEYPQNLFNAIMKYAKG